VHEELEEPIPSPDTVSCPRCGLTYEASEIYCVECGTDLMTGQKVNYGTRKVGSQTGMMLVLLAIMMMFAVLRWAIG